MTFDRIERASSRARKAYVRHSRAAFNAESPRAKSRHERRAKVAASTLVQCQRDAARLFGMLDA